jgi:predicted flap endonuclease-1-like 5' DNA nuclease
MTADRAMETSADEGRPMQFAPPDGEGSRASGILDRSHRGAGVDPGAVAGESEAPGVADEEEAAREGVSESSNGATGPQGAAAARSAADRVGTVPTVEREASPVASAMQLGKDRDDEIEITTDDAEHRGTVNAAGDEDAIEVSDDELETADPAQLRGTLPSPPSSFGVARSRPPMRPSLRPRAPSSVPLPPPRNGTLPPTSRTGVDPWLLANKTLELAHAHARIAELEEQAAFRDARIIELEENLVKARRKLGELREPAAAVGEAPVVTQTRAAVHPPGAAARAVTLPSGPGPLDSGAARALDEDEGDDDTDGEDLEEVERDSAFDVTSRAASSGTEEDLQQISGIGPRFEAALRRQGITRLSQIAAWSEADVRQVAKALKIPKSRIVKGRWVEVAREVIGTRAASE